MTPPQTTEARAPVQLKGLLTGDPHSLANLHSLAAARAVHQQTHCGAIHLRLDPRTSRSTRPGARPGRGVLAAVDRGTARQDVDLLSATLTVAQSKNGHQRTVPMNATVRSVLLDASLSRKHTDQPDERVFPQA